MQDVRALNEMVAAQSAMVDDLMAEVGKVIVGQTHMVERLLIGILAGGHVLLEGCLLQSALGSHARVS